MRGDRDLCILFLYHKCDAVTKTHLDSLRKSNPNATIIPVTDSVPELLPGSVDVGLFPTTFDTTHKWRGIDTTLYRWFENRTCDARRYLMIEYDCFCNVDLDDYYSEIRQADVAGIDLFNQEENPRWKWFMSSELDKIPKEDRKYAAGIVPLTCTMFSHQALEAVVKNMYRNDVFCELRLGTVIKKLGLKFEPLSVPKRSTICWHMYPWRTEQEGLFHSVKSLDHNKGKGRRPGIISSHFYDWFRLQTRDREFLPFNLQGKRHGLRRRLGLK